MIKLSAGTFAEKADIGRGITLEGVGTNTASTHTIITLGVNILNTHSPYRDLTLKTVIIRSNGAAVINIQLGNYDTMKTLKIL